MTNIEDTNNIIDDVFLITGQFSSSNTFSLYIEERVAKEKISYMDAIIAYCEEQDIDIESIKPLVNKSLKQKIHVEAEEKNYFRNKKGKLPL